MVNAKNDVTGFKNRKMKMQMKKEIVFSSRKKVVNTKDDVIGFKNGEKIKKRRLHLARKKDGGIGFMTVKKMAKIKKGDGKIK